MIFPFVWALLRAERSRAATFRSCDLRGSDGRGA